MTKSVESRRKKFIFLNLHCLNDDDAVLRKLRPPELQLNVTFSLKLTKTLSGSGRIIDKPLTLSSGNETHLASVQEKSKNLLKITQHFMKNIDIQKC